MPIGLCCPLPSLIGVRCCVGLSSFSTMSDVNVRELINSRLQRGGVPKESLELHRLISLTRDDDWPPCKGWQKVRQRLETHPSEARALDRRGRTALMAAMHKASHAPREILRAILQETKFGLEAARDKSGLTALAIALQVQAPIESIKTLLQKNGNKQVLTSDHQGNLPVHWAVTRSQSRTLMDDRQRRIDLLQLFMSLAPPDRQLLHGNVEGKTPLHVALESRMPYRLIEALVEACPEALASSACGYSPLMAAIKESASMEVLELLVQTYPQAADETDLDDKFPLRRFLETRRQFSMRAVHLLCRSAEAVLHKDSYGRSCLTYILERWTSHPVSVQPEVVEILLQHAPQASSDPQTVRAIYHHLKADEDNWWPVVQHLLVSWEPESAYTGGALDALIRTNAPVVAFRKLLSEHPEAAKQVDDHGYTALHTACLHRWSDRDAVLELLLERAPEQALVVPEDGTTAMHLAASIGRLPLSLLSDLIKAFPEATTMQSRDNGLYPFLVAASNAVEEEHSTLCLSTIYLLIHAAPDLLDIRRAR